MPPPRPANVEMPMTKHRNEPSERTQALLRRLPGVDRLLELARSEACFELVPVAVPTGVGWAAVP